jgi:hypothetical protein
MRLLPRPPLEEPVRTLFLTNTRLDLTSFMSTARPRLTLVFFPTLDVMPKEPTQRPVQAAEGAGHQGDPV